MTLLEHIVEGTMIGGLILVLILATLMGTRR